MNGGAGEVEYCLSEVQSGGICTNLTGGLGQILGWVWRLQVNFNVFLGVS